MQFDEKGEPVLSVDFDWITICGDDGCGEVDKAKDAAAAVKKVLYMITMPGSPESMGLRALALARQAGLFETDGAAASRAGVDRTTILRARARILAALHTENE